MLRSMPCERQLDNHRYPFIFLPRLVLSTRVRRISLERAHSSLELIASFLDDRPGNWPPEITRSVANTKADAHLRLAEPRDGTDRQ